MAMDPRTHPRGAPPDFTLPRPNPNPSRMTDALWWLVTMRQALEPNLSANGGTFAVKPGSHNAGENLPDYGEGDLRTDHSIRHAWNRTGTWWKTKTAAHDWTFKDAQAGDYRTINKYTGRMLRAMRDPDDLRPDDVVFYTLGQEDGDPTVEGWHELRNEVLSSSDLSHLWHRHDSFFRNVVGSYPHMWQVLTIDMGWSFADWQRSVAPAPVIDPEVDVTTPSVPEQTWLQDIDRSAGAYTAGGALWVILGRSGHLNQLPALKAKLDELVADTEVDFDALGASLALINAKLDLLLADPTDTTEPPAPAA